MESMHTKGPWTVQPYQHDHGDSTAIVGPERALVVALIPPDPENESDRTTDRANAKLIAAAPDLLEALQTLVRRIERDNLHTTHGVKLADAKAAISKAS